VTDSADTLRLLRSAFPVAPASAEVAPGPVWVPTKALGRAVLLTGVLVVFGVALGRVDLVLLAAPFALGAAIGLRRLPRSAPELTIGGDDDHIVEGGVVTAEVTIANPDVIPYDLVVARVRHSPWMNLREADRPFALTVAADGWTSLDFEGTARRWGRQDVGPAAARVAACGGLLACRPVVVPARGVRVYPETEPFAATEAMPAAAGLVGNHRSRRPGEGGELAGVRPFAPGDRLRRIDWRVSLRTRDLHVASTLSDRDAEVLLLLDVLGEAGDSGGVKGKASVLDTTVRAAAAIAEHYLQRGQRLLRRPGGRADPARRPARRRHARRPRPVGPVHRRGGHPSGRRRAARDGTVDPGGDPAVAPGARERPGPPARARRAGRQLGRCRQPGPRPARRRPPRLGAEGALTWHFSTASPAGWPAPAAPRPGPRFFPFSYASGSVSLFWPRWESPGRRAWSAANT
jgi:uncharacterized protein (DUF58 family)